MNKICRGCKKHIDVCPYGGDCLEVSLIARQRQAEINLDCMDDYPEDTPTVDHCDDHDTGEGRYHGRM